MPTPLIRDEKPPIYDAALLRFDITDKDVANDRIIFAYKGEIWNPSGKPIHESAVIHEIVHFGQQGEDSDHWWYKYLTDDQFRLDMEIPAYRTQYRWCKKYIKDRNAVAEMLHCVSTDLSSKMYGNLVTYAEAKKAISS